MTEKKFETFKWIIWINLIFGIQNLYFYVVSNHMFNLIIGGLNIYVWVAFRHIAFSKYKRKKNERR